jgi:hypothetical protein
VDSCVVVLDSLLIDPATCVIEPAIPFAIEGKEIRFDCDDPGVFLGKIISIKYRTLAIDLYKPTFFLDTTQLKERETAVYIGYDYSPYRANAGPGLFESSALNYSGSLSRGFSVGNSQSLVLNSNLNLQLNGDLGNGIKVVAAISDDNIPIQADGNTQVLQEFDKVFIQVSKDKTSVIAGDYDLQSEQSYFLNYYKKLQGLRLDNELTLTPESKISSRANFAISRGKFARQMVAVREGNQGPYKLIGNNGERFLIVLQGSEKVYYDGALLLRGQDNDYVIDYNNAEIIFMPNRIVTREARIIVEYEYTDQNYLRSLYAINSEYETEKYKLNFNFYNEQDSKNATGQIELDSMDVKILSGSDGNPGSLLRSGIRDVDLEILPPNSILYVREVDRMTGDTILTYTKVISPDVVTAVFSEVGQGRGAYVIDSDAGANGRVYKYVGQGQGVYLPVIQLIAPEKRQMMSVGTEVKLSNSSKVYGEASISNFDDNRFSNLDNGNNQGHAFKAGYLLKQEKNVSRGWQPLIDLNYEYVKDDFRFLNPFRSAEFTRDWNTALLTSADEHLINGRVELKKQGRFTGTYRFSMYNRKDQYLGSRHNPQLQYTDSLNTISLDTDMLFSQGTFENSRFYRPKIEASRKFKRLNYWSLRLKYLGENNTRKDAVTDGLINSSFSFDEYYVYIDSPVSNDYQVSFFGKRRTDRLPQANQLAVATDINELGMNGRYRTTNSALVWNLSYRDFQVDIPDLVNETNTSTLLGRVDYSLKALDGFMNLTTSYNLGSGQEAKREFQFIKVEKGEGTYIYLGDLNEDGADQINEYEVAVFSDQADFIRVNVVNNEFIRTENQGINQSLRLSPEKLFETNKGLFADLLSRITTSTIFRIDQKQSSDGEGGIKVFSFNRNDTSLVSYNSLINNTLFFNRGNPLYDFQIGRRSTSNRFVQITGYEERSISENFLRTRMNPASYLDVIAEIEIGTQLYDSEFFDNKDLDVSFYKINPSINYRPSTNLRLSLKYAYENKEQKINEQEEAKSNEFSLEATWRQASRSSIVGSLSLVNISYTGAINTPVAYTILSGLNKGKNVLWSLNLTRRLAGNVDLNLNYNGRKTGDTPTVHVARVQVRANF